MWRTFRKDFQSSKWLCFLRIKKFKFGVCILWICKESQFYGYFIQLTFVFSHLFTPFHFFFSCDTYTRCLAHSVPFSRPICSMCSSIVIWIYSTFNISIWIVFLCHWQLSHPIDTLCVVDMNYWAIDFIECNWLIRFRNCFMICLSLWIKMQQT